MNSWTHCIFLGKWWRSFRIFGQKVTLIFSKSSQSEIDHIDTPTKADDDIQPEVENSEASQKATLKVAEVMRAQNRQNIGRVNYYWYFSSKLIVIEIGIQAYDKPYCVKV